MGGAEQAVFRRLFGSTNHFADGPQTQAFVVAQFKNRSLPGRELFESAVNLAAQLAIPHLTLGVGMRGTFFQLRHAIHHAFGGFNDSGFLPPNLTATEVVEADIGNNPIQPGVERTIEPESVEVPVDLQKSLLVDIARFIRRPQKVHGDAEDTLVVGPHQTLESILVALLGRADQPGFVCLRLGSRHPGTQKLYGFVHFFTVVTCLQMVCMQSLLPALLGRRSQKNVTR